MKDERVLVTVWGIYDHIPGNSATVSVRFCTAEADNVKLSALVLIFSVPFRFSLVVVGRPCSENKRYKKGTIECFVKLLHNIKVFI